MMAVGVEREIQALHVIDPHPRRVERLEAGEVGMVVAGIKTLAEVRIGDTLTDARAPAAEPLPGFRKVKPMVFTGLYPVDADAYSDLKAALEKLQLNDASLLYEPETSARSASASAAASSASCTPRSSRSGSSASTTST